MMYHYSRPTSGSDSSSSNYGLSLQYPDEAGPPSTNTVLSRYPQSCGCSETREVSTFPATKYVAVSVTNVYIGVIKIKNNFERVPMVARVSIADYRGNVILDTFVRPTHRVEDYRTAETGIQYSHLVNGMYMRRKIISLCHLRPLCVLEAPLFQDVQRQVAHIIEDKIIIGHSIWTFLSVLGLVHPAISTRDLALYRPLRKKLKSRTIIGLPTLVHLFMGRNVGLDYENSVSAQDSAVFVLRSAVLIFLSWI
ncbi:hypothetical protein AX14_007779 [Amanita brunnescens Koide BX004]|nr:hypothetical protein AX14_007779 [Amanita brunnescens Koide BX004]